MESTKIIPIQPWTYSLSNCGPISYSVSYGQSGIIPAFIKFSSSNMVISVYTNDG